MNKSILDIIIIGTGSYVCGKGEKNYGTIVPSIITYSKRYKQAINIIFACNSKKGKENAKEKSNFILEMIDPLSNVTFNYVECFGGPSQFLKNYTRSTNKVAAIVSIPDHFHYSWIKAILEEGIPVLTVKPLTLELNKSIELSQLSRSLGVPSFVEFHKRYDKQLRFAKDKFNSGEIGQPIYSYTEYTQRKTIPIDVFKNWVLSTNIFSYLGVHYVDALHYITDSIPLRVSATGQKIFLIKEGIDTYDSIQCSIIWQDKNNNFFNQTILCSWVESNLSTAMSGQNFNLIGTHGRIECEQKNRGLSYLTDIKPIEHINPDFTRLYSYESNNIFEGYGIDSVTNFIHYILGSDLCIKDRRLCTFEEASISTSVIEAANKSLRNNSVWIPIKIPSY